MKILYKNLMSMTSPEALICVEDTSWDCLTKPSSLIILRDDNTKASVKEILDSGLSKLAEEHHIIIVFPNP